MPEIYLIPREDLPNAWPDVAHYVQAMADASHGKFSTKDMVNQFVANNYQLWVSIERDLNDKGTPNGAFVGRVVDFPGRRVYEPIAVAGENMIKNKPTWLKMLAIIEAWAKGQGCTLMQPLASPGFEWILRDAGYKKSHVLLEKEI